VTDRRAAARYAEALLGVAAEQQAIGPVRQELAALVALVEATPALRDLLARPDVDPEQKERAITVALGDRFSEAVVSMLLVLLRHQRGEDLPAVGEMYEELADEAEGLVRAEARAAVPLTEEEQRRLASALARLIGKRVILETRLDPSVLAGVVVEVGGRLIDGSAAGRLARMREELLARAGE
jgi:F-type H+-transporting ATPase subunit delta